MSPFDSLNPAERFNAIPSPASVQPSAHQAEALITPQFQSDTPMVDGLVRAPELILEDEPKVPQASGRLALQLAAEDSSEPETPKEQSLSASTANLTPEEVIPAPGGGGSEGGDYGDADGGGSGGDYGGDEPSGEGEDEPPKLSPNIEPLIEYVNSQGLAPEMRYYHDTGHLYYETSETAPVAISPDTADPFLGALYQNFLDYRGQERTRLRELIPEARASSDYNIDRITAFVTKVGLQQIGEYIIFDGDNPKVVSTVHNEIGQTYAAWGGIAHDSGLYLYKHSPENDELHGEGYNESSLLHEIGGHGSAQNSTFVAHVIQQPDGSFSVGFRNRGTGFVTDEATHGIVLEEGFSESLRARYIREELGLENGLTNAKKLTTELNVGGNTVSVHTIYRRGRPEGGFAYNDHGMAGTLVDLLVERDENLWPAMVEARNNPSPTDALTEVSGRINAIKAGLWNAIQDIPLEPQNGLKGLMIVNAALGR
jgi:hypothetical protein